MHTDHSCMRTSGEPAVICLAGRRARSNERVSGIATKAALPSVRARTIAKDGVLHGKRNATGHGIRGQRGPTEWHNNDKRTPRRHRTACSHCRASSPEPHLMECVSLGASHVVALEPGTAGANVPLMGVVFVKRVVSKGYASTAIGNTVHGVWQIRRVVRQRERVVAPIRQKAASQPMRTLVSE